GGGGGGAERRARLPRGGEAGRRARAGVRRAGARWGARAALRSLRGHGTERRGVEARRGARAGARASLANGVRWARRPGGRIRRRKGRESAMRRALALALVALGCSSLPPAPPAWPPSRHFFYPDPPPHL